MATVLNRTSKRLIRSANTPDYPAADWIHSPDLSLVAGVPNKYWNITGDLVTEMTQPEKDAVDAAEASQRRQDARDSAKSDVDDIDGDGVRVRQLIETFNKRDNYLVNRILELQAALDAMKASTGGTANLRDAIPSGWLPTRTRTRAQAVQEYKADIDGGASDG